MKLLLESAHFADIDTAVGVMDRLSGRTSTYIGDECNADRDAYHKSLTERGKG